MTAFTLGQFVKSLDPRDDHDLFFVVVETGVQHLTEPASAITLPGDDERRAVYRFDRLLASASREIAHEVADVERIAAELDDRPVHRPAAPDAPIPGRHWYSGCDPDRPRVRPDGVCAGCGEHACPDCGHEPYPDGVCGCPA
jgi:hypothetical protein